MFGNELLEGYEEGALQGNGALDIGEARARSVEDRPDKNRPGNLRSILVLGDGIPKDIYEGSCNIRQNGDQ